jgi:hypothetical protein
MPVQLEAEAVCNNCGKKAPCKLDCDVMVRRTPFEIGEAVSGLNTWYFKSGHGAIACSEDCRDALAKDETYIGTWLPCR